MKIAPITAHSIADAMLQLTAVLGAGDVPLMVDPRWPESQLRAILDTAASAALPTGTAWAAATSGTSGSSRIVVRSRDSWESSFAAINAILGAVPGDKILLPAPPASSLTLFSLAHALVGGPSPVGLEDPGAVAQATLFHGTPQALRTLLDRNDAPALRTALVGGSHLDEALRLQARERGIRVVAYYGAAELSFVAADHGDGLRAFPGVELRAADQVLWVRSPFVSLGYLGSQGPLLRDGDWATVGDRAEINDGRLRLLGRSDDAILSASATIVPEEVEAVLRGVPGVRDAVVFAWPSGPVGALVAAMIEGDGPNLEALKSAANLQLAPAHRPRLWFHGQLPRTSSGKPARATAAKLAIDGKADRLVD